MHQPNAVELQRKLMEVALGRDVSEDEAIRKLAEEDYSLMSQKEVTWRKSLKPGDVVYVWDDAGWAYGPHFFRVTKIGTKNIHTFGIRHMHNIYGKIFTSKYKYQFERETGRLAGSMTNKSVALHSKPSHPWHEKGLTETKYKILRNDHPHPLYGGSDKDTLHKDWLEYKMDDENN